MSYDTADRPVGSQVVILTRDHDVLDTWFSSALWPFGTLGWPDENPLHQLERAGSEASRERKCRASPPSHLRRWRGSSLSRKGRGVTSPPLPQ